MSREGIISDIMAVTTYSKAELEEFPTDRLFAMRNRIQRDTARYRSEIQAYYLAHPEEAMPDEEFYSLKYNDLCALRKELGLAGKKVKHTEEAPLLAEQAREDLGRKRTAEVARDAIVASSTDHEMYRYMREIIEMGYGDYSIEELASVGIIPLDYDESHLKK